ncbi:cell death-inducing p53-target protein 1 isoform X2 [Felis catus]|uniref:cell death-inducing p53-target protein 1 isoform X2 n=1 Tax=Felis catus TaxID=9685 RepID=UPI001D19ED71|nr:cell death-inducing p53-target protein 1 isoform X2 [Felis catus]
MTSDRGAPSPRLRRLRGACRALWSPRPAERASGAQTDYISQRPLGGRGAVCAQSPAGLRVLSSQRLDPGLFWRSLGLGRPASRGLRRNMPTFMSLFGKEPVKGAAHPRKIRNYRSGCIYEETQRNQLKASLFLSHTEETGSGNLSACVVSLVFHGLGTVTCLWCGFHAQGHLVVKHGSGSCCIHIPGSGQEGRRTKGGSPLAPSCQSLHHYSMTHWPECSRVVTGDWTKGLGVS